MLSEGLFLVNRTAPVRGNMKSPTVCTFRLPTIFSGGNFCENVLLHRQYTDTVLCRGSETFPLETLLDRGLITKFLYLANDACFLSCKTITN